ncbi:hydroxysqualene dehydroxylase HpnE [Schlesneria paludicola]|uniref:hydroxysqualene dehydroxylase HpnE n=1 Tax=Schlesneria paludicola TaxID=360056 RepID=UPI00029A4303|nr:hydroxysqualene dehydroxylase HpnE [Schlesneria paludicola]
MPRHIVIVGGGLAGLAAAVALTDRGFPCTLLESRPRLGGRASSFHDPTTGVEIDNCQHVTLGCCTNFRHFCQTTGLSQYFHREPTLYFIGPQGKVDRFSANALPAPFHLTAAFARLSYLSWKDKFALARGLKALARPVSDAEEARPFSEWLRQHHQTDAAIERFWLVVLVSALSESLDRISVRHARKVFVDAFLAHRDGWYVDIPTVPLEDLYGGQLVDWLTSRGTTIRLQSAGERVELSNRSVTGVRLTSQEFINADELVIALPFHRVMSVLPPELASRPEFRGVNSLQAAPIASIHLWFDRPITELRHAVLVERLCQWVFNRTAIARTHDASTSSTSSSTDPLENAHYYQIVISASRNLAGQSKEQIQQQVLDELSAVWPATKDAKLLHARQVTEHRAVFSPVPEIDNLRPVQQTSIANLQLAGDWTHTGWPATMEGAVRSGYLAAENVLRRCGQTDSLVQPDLKTALGSRLLFGL